MIRRSTLAAAALAAGCGGPRATPANATPVVVATVAADRAAPSTDAGPPGGQAPRRAKLIAKMLREVSAARGLAATRAVPGVVLPRDALIARVKEHVAIEIPPEAIRREGLAMQVLGFLPTTFDYAAEVFALLEAQLAGFYEPTDGTMYMAGDLDDENAEATLAHELVHALQDQHWDLKLRSKYKPGQSDRSSALSCLAEGDATSAMADILVSHMNPDKTALDLPEDVFVAQVMSSVSTGPSAKAPHIMRASLVSPYVDGTLFVHALRRRGGWAMVDRAWTELPATTEQILHADKWEAREPALEVSVPTWAALGTGWAVVDEDTYGEQGLRLSFAEWATGDEATIAAAGWGGDRAALITQGDRVALAIHARYDPSPEAPADAFAVRAFRILSAAIGRKPGKPALNDASLVCVERRALGPLAIARRGREIAIVAGPASTANAWSSLGTCHDAKRWAAEVLGNR